MSAVLFFLACGSPSEPAAPEPVVAPAPEPEPAQVEPEPEEAWRVPLRARMHEHFAYATDATYYVILGDVEKVRAKGQALADLDDPSIPSDWRPGLDQMLAAAKRVTEVGDVDQAADAVVALGQACASCHAAKGGPVVALDEVLGGGWSSQEAMQKHQWAAYLMWLGVVLPAEDVFQAGVTELGHESALPKVPPGLEALDGQVHDLAVKAAAARDEATRGKALATFLKTCASCHEQAGVVFE